MTFYHYTSPAHLPSIIRDGQIRTTESNVAGDVAYAGPSVVWLLDEPVAVRGVDGLMSVVDKTLVRIEVDVQAIRWLDWQWTAYMDPRWKEALIESGGGIERAEHWYLYPVPIQRRRWREVARRGETGGYWPLPDEEWQS